MLTFRTMRIRRVVFGALATACLVESVFACGSMDAVSSSAPGRNPDDPPKHFDPTSDGGAHHAFVVHAAAFPAIRLCFGGALDRVPLPDTELMPNANVVGVETGSYAKVPTLESLGRVYVLHERAVRAIPGGSTIPCRELLGDGTASLVPNIDYHVAGTLPASLGLQSSQALVITGCGGKAFLDRIGASTGSCGEGWNATDGNLSAKLLDLPEMSSSTSAPTHSVQIAHVSPAIDKAFSGAGVRVTFGKLKPSDESETVLAADLLLFKTSDPSTISIDPSDERIYGTHGFRVTTPSLDGGGALEFSRSLAEIQDVSAPREIPTRFYAESRNFTLLLIGDPSAANDQDGGFTTSERRRPQFLAIPLSGRDSGAMPPLDDAGQNAE
jgi:hypothetical protein